MSCIQFNPHSNNQRGSNNYENYSRQHNCRYRQQSRFGRGGCCQQNMFRGGNNSNRSNNNCQQLRGRINNNNNWNWPRTFSEVTKYLRGNYTNLPIRQNQTFDTLLRWARNTNQLVIKTLINNIDYLVAPNSNINEIFFAKCIFIIMQDQIKFNNLMNNLFNERNNIRMGFRSALTVSQENNKRQYKQFKIISALAEIVKVSPQMSERAATVIKKLGEKLRDNPDSFFPDNQNNIFYGLNRILENKALGYNYYADVAGLYKNILDRPQRNYNLIQGNANYLIEGFRILSNDKFRNHPNYNNISQYSQNAIQRINQLNDQNQGNASPVDSDYNNSDITDNNNTESEEEMEMEEINNDHLNNNNTPSNNNNKNEYLESQPLYANYGGYNNTQQNSTPSQHDYYRRLYGSNNFTQITLNPTQQRNDFNSIISGLEIGGNTNTQ